MSFPFQPGIWVLMLIVPTLLITMLGWLVGRAVVQARPAPFLREDG